MGVRVREEEEQGRGERTSGERRRPPQKKKGREGRILELTTGLDCDQGTIARNHMRYERFDSSSRAPASLQPFVMPNIIGSCPLI